MDKKSYKSFDEFYKKGDVKNNKKTKEEIIADAERIRIAHQKRKEENA